MKQRRPQRRADRLRAATAFAFARIEPSADVILRIRGNSPPSGAAMIFSEFIQWLGTRLGKEHIARHSFVSGIRHPD